MIRRASAKERLLYRHATGHETPPCLVIRWPLWWHRFRGVALGSLIFVEDDTDPLLVCHEIVHVAQFRADPLRFWFRYFRELFRVGYSHNRYERQAQAIENRARRALAALNSCSQNDSKEERPSMAEQRSRPGLG